MRPRIRNLTVTIYGKPAGHIKESGGSLVFEYDPSYLASENPTPLSLSMPLSDSRYTRRVVEPFLKGLLPDNAQVRSRWATHFGLKDGDTFGLVTAIGRDVAGGAVFTPDFNSGETDQESGLEDISESQIGERLQRLRDNESEWLEEDEHWSLAGAQSKFTLRKTRNGWAIPHGDEPSTHIVKPGISQLPGHALIEHVSMVTAANLGLKVSSSEYLQFNGLPAIVVERFDRIDRKGEVRRIHQEDLCQVFGIDPGRKHESNGGPGVERIVEQLRLRANDDSVERFTQAVIVNYLLGAPDAHAKNYSILLVGNQVTLAPLYDVGSGLAYTRDESVRLRYSKGAMSIGGRRAFGELSYKNWVKFARAIRLEEDQILEWVTTYTDALPDALNDAIKTVPSRVRDRALLRTAFEPRVHELIHLTRQGLLPEYVQTHAKGWGAQHLAKFGEG